MPTLICAGASVLVLKLSEPATKYKNL
eukprot:COSAG06_NODE_32185_length_510_cov_0.445255_1_plen_26_part_10